MCSSGLVWAQMCDLFPAEVRTHMAKCSTGSHIMKTIPIAQAKDGKYLFTRFWPPELGPKHLRKSPVGKTGFPCWKNPLMAWRATRLFLKCPHDFYTSALLFVWFSWIMSGLLSESFYPCQSVKSPTEKKKKKTLWSLKIAVLAMNSLPSKCHSPQAQLPLHPWVCSHIHSALQVPLMHFPRLESSVSNGRSEGLLWQEP